MVVGPSGVGWVPYHEPSGASELLPPSIFPPSAVAAADSANFTASGVSDALVPLEADLTSPSVPLGTGIRTSGPSAITSTYHGLTGTGSSIPSASINTGIRAPSLSSSQIPYRTGISGSSLSGIGFSAQSLLTGSTSAFGTTSKTTNPASISGIAPPEAVTNAAIVPISYVTAAFNDPTQTITTLSLSGQPAIIYSKETFPALFKITAPTTIQPA